MGTSQLDRLTIEGLKENRLRKEVLIPLFEAMGFRGISDHHGGSGEQGKDIVMWKNGVLEEREDYGVVVKAGKISGKARGKSSASEVFFQIQQCLGSAYPDLLTLRERPIDVCWVVCSGELTKEARVSLTHALKGTGYERSVRFIDGGELWRLVQAFLHKATAQPNLTVQSETDNSTILFSADEYLRRLQTVAEAISKYQRTFHYARMVYTYTILEDFSYRIDEIETLSPADDDLLIYWKYYGGTIPAVSIDSLGFRADLVEPDAGQGITWLPAKNEPLQKEFLVFPLPPMKIGEPARTIHFSALWPGGAEPLKAPHGRDVFQVLVHRKAASPVRSVEINIKFDAPGTYLVQLVQERSHEAADATDWQECRIDIPYQAQFEEVLGGTLYSFHVHRRS